MHAAEAARGWVCVTCAMEAVDRGRRTIYRWRDEGLVRSERVGRLAYFSLADLAVAEASGRRAAFSRDALT